MRKVVVYQDDTEKVRDFPFFRKQLVTGSQKVLLCHVILFRGGT